MNFRPFTPDDLSACIAVAKSTVPQYLDAAEVPLFAEFLHVDLKRANTRYCVGCVEGQVLACGGTAIDESGVAHMCWGLVHQDHHGRGYGNALVRRRLDWLGPGVPIQMNTSQHTVAFYERFGFERTGVVVKDGYGIGLHKISMLRAAELETHAP